MKHRNEARGFSLVELLAVVLVLAVLAAIAVPLYLNTRKTSAARTCKANIAAIAAAESAYATRFGKFNGGTATVAGTDVAWEAAYVAGAAGVAPTGGLLGAPEGIADVPTCPLKGSHYGVAAGAAGVGPCIIQCPDHATHATDTGQADTWTKTLQPAGNDTTNPL